MEALQMNTEPLLKIPVVFLASAYSRRQIHVGQWAEGKKYQEYQASPTGREYADFDFYDQPPSSC